MKSMSERDGDGECAYCGRFLARGMSQPVTCEDCRTEHSVCATCAREVAGVGDAVALAA